MSKEEKVINFYILCNILKNTIRTGWKDWNVSKERLESVAEHIFGAQMLAIAIKSEFEYDIDIMKVIYMLAIHELGETIIEDIPPFKMSASEKERIEHEAVHKILKDLLDGEQIEEMFLEFDERCTKEALFAYECDKLEADLQSKIYDEEGYVDVKNQKGNIAMKDPMVKLLLTKGYSFGQMWLKYSKYRYPYDNNFQSISDYATNNMILKKRNS